MIKDLGTEILYYICKGYISRYIYDFPYEVKRSQGERCPNAEKLAVGNAKSWPVFQWEV